MGYYKDLGDNKYRLFAEAGYDKKGRRKRRSRVVQTSGVREVRKLLTAFENEVEDAEAEMDNVSFSNFVDRWRNAYALPKLSASTREVYEGILRYLVPIFGDYTMKEIQTIDLVEFFAKEIQEDKKSLEKKYNIMLSLFTHAHKWNIIKSNTMDGVSKPKIKRKRREPYTREELALLATHFPSMSIYHQRIIKTTVECALRRGEVVAIAADVLDFENERILIKRSLQYTKEKGLLLKSTKEEDETFIHVTSELMNELKAQYQVAINNMENAGSNWVGFRDEEGIEVIMLFADDLGVPYHPNAITRFWGRFLERTKMRSISFHDLRHSSASIMVRDGINTKAVQARLRHKNITTTMNTYVHSDHSDDKGAGETFKGMWDV